jgi:hypothetical protein
LTQNVNDYWSDIVTNGYLLYDGQRSTDFVRRPAWSFLQYVSQF